MSLGDAFSLACVMEAHLDDQGVRGHKCPSKFLLLMADEEDVLEQVVEADQDDAMESGDISILNYLAGHDSPHLLQLSAMIRVGK
nr:hypothetical protein [Tanacetum cinerariifolium]